MKWNICQLAMAAMVVSVTARPSVFGTKSHAVAVRHVRGGAVGQLFRRDDDDDEEEESGYSAETEEEAEEEADEEEDEDEDDEEDGDDDQEDDGGDDGTDDDDSAEDGESTTASSGGYATASATATGGYSYSTKTPTSTASGSYTTGSGSSSGSGSSGGSLPASSGTSALAAVKTIAAGESFDGGMVMFDRGVDCTGQEEGGESDAVFSIEEGGSLSNVIIGPNQIEGIHCHGACTLTNVWWSAVCEDAFTIKDQAAGDTTTITGGGAYGAADKVLQHNAGGTLSVSGFTVDDFGKLFRSCGNCDEQEERHIIISDCTASNGDLIAGINSNYGDTATITNLSATGVEEICEQFEGNDTGDEPTSISTGADGTYCIIN